MPFVINLFIMDEERRRVRIKKSIAVVLYLIVVGILDFITLPLPWYRIFPIMIIAGIFIKLTIWPQPMTLEEIVYRSELKVEREIIRSRPILKYGLYALIGLILLVLVSAVYEPWFKLLFPIAFALLFIGTFFFFGTLSDLRDQKNERKSRN